MSIRAKLALSSGMLIPASLLVAIALAGFWRSGDGHEAFALENLAPETAHAYRFAEAHPVEMQTVPCYCGCVSLAHQDLLECFVKRAGGYEPHASACDICAREAAVVEQMLGQGAGVAAIRAAIDKDYAKYGRPTDTPGGETE